MQFLNFDLFLKGKGYLNTHILSEKVIREKVIAP